MLPHQHALEHAIAIDPAPAIQATHIDYFGNVMTFFAMQGPHTGLTVSARSRVCITAPELPVPSDTPPWDQVAGRDLPLEALELTFDPLPARVLSDVCAYARPSFAAGRPLLEAVIDLTARIHDDFTFDPDATTVTTPVADFFRTRRGVCQDFARLGLACLRSLGLAAHYVSGYLETTPPPGKSRQLGADASHAWLGVYCPGHGWIDVDPTNNLLPSTTHVTLAWGRDYADVSPVRGVILGAASTRSTSASRSCARKRRYRARPSSRVRRTRDAARTFMVRERERSFICSPLRSPSADCQTRSPVDSASPDSCSAR
jgi:transglutaminase-like putative cysteine protease